MTGTRMKFDGSDSARQMSRIFAENLNDLVRKVDKGNGSFETGFFHTSTLLHEGVCYYDSTWSRDAGRGLIELARFGFIKEAALAADYLLQHINMGDHWGRTIQYDNWGKYEIDGNALILLGLYNIWNVGGRMKETGIKYIECTMPVFRWMEQLMEQCPYGHLLPCESEMSGNPDTPYQVYAIFPNFAARTAMSAYREMAVHCKCSKEAQYFNELDHKLSASILDRLVAGATKTLVPGGCWINGLDGRDGRPYEFSEWGGTAWPIFHWTRQLPFILTSDYDSLSLQKDGFHSANFKSYEYILKHMCSNRYFRKYGFVSNTCWTGTGGRHDDTMCGYGQGFMTQAALMADDINSYTKLLEGIARLAYDGEVLEPMAFDMNPWIMHECFSYENYEEGYDHTYGVMSEGRPGLMDNQGDEGNLVQEAEILKAIGLMAGIDTSNPKHLKIMPRIPWTWDEILVRDYPVTDGEGNSGKLEFRMVHERWLGKCSFSVASTLPLERVDVRVGPFPSYIEIEEGLCYSIDKTKGGTWIWIKNLSGVSFEREITLRR